MRGTMICNISEHEVIQNYENGLSMEVIAKQNNCSYRTINNILKSKNVKIRSRLKKSQDILNKVVELYNGGMSCYKIAKELNVGNTTVNRHLKKLGFNVSEGHRKNDNGLVKEKTQEVIDLFNSGIGCYKLAKQFETTESTILRILHKNNIKIRGPKKYNCNENFFENIDTKEKAWVLGLWLSDGCNVFELNTISVSMIDLDVIEKIKKLIGFDGPIIENKPRKSHHKIQYSIRIYSKKMCADLNKLGCGPRKSFNVDCNLDLSDELFKSLLLGESDGDGGFTIDKKTNRWIWKVIGSVQFINRIRNKLIQILDISGSYFEKRYSKGNLAILAIGGAHQLYKFTNWLYSDQPYSMDRKRNQYLEFKKFYETKHKIDEKV